MYCDALAVERWLREEVGESLGVGTESVAEDEVVTVRDGGGKSGDVVGAELGRS